MKSNILDVLIIAGSTLVLMPMFYFISSAQPNLWSGALYIMIIVPTLAALVNGAPFIPTPMKAVNRMIKIGKLKKGDKVYDIGCGDGRFVHFASKKQGVEAVGLELSPLVYIIARIRKLLWNSKAKIKFGSFKKHNLSDADVIFCYLLPETLTALAPKLQAELKPGARIVSYAFPIATWKETEKYEKEPDSNIAPIWVYEKK